jgi:ParB family chromosome partitioning protein
MSKLKSLARSLKKHGQRQPVEVIRVYGDPNADYELVIGERRWRAATLDGLEGVTHLNAILRDKKDIPDKKTQRRVCLVADHHHEKYSKLETALAILEEKNGGATPEELRDIFGHNDSWICMHLALNDLVPELKRRLDPNLPRGEQLSVSIGYRLARFPKDQQMEAFRQITSLDGARLQLFKANELLAELVPGNPSGRGRPRKPADYIRNLRLIVPRATADALTASAYPDKAFDSLIDNASDETVQTMHSQIVAAINRLSSLQAKIKAAQKRRQKK